MGSKLWKELYNSIAKVTTERKYIPQRFGALWQNSLFRNVRTAKSLTAKCPYGEVSSRRNVLTAKCPYDEVSVRKNVLRQNIVRRKVLRRKVRSRVIALLSVAQISSNKTGLHQLETKTMWGDHSSSPEHSKVEQRAHPIFCQLFTWRVLFFSKNLILLLEKPILSRIYSCAFFAKMLCFRVIGAQVLINTCI